MGQRTFYISPRMCRWSIDVAGMVSTAPLCDVETCNPEVTLHAISPVLLCIIRSGTAPIITSPSVFVDTILEWLLGWYKEAHWPGEIFTVISSAYATLLHSREASLQACRIH